MKDSPKKIKKLSIHMLTCVKNCKIYMYKYNLSLYTYLKTTFLSILFMWVWPKAEPLEALGGTPKL